MNTTITDSDSIPAPQQQAAIVQKSTQRTLSPLVGLLAFSTALIAACTLPPYLILRTRLARVDGAINDVLHIARNAQLHQEQATLVMHELGRARQEVDVLRGQVDRVAGDVRDVRSVLLKERVRLAAIETRFDGLSEQLKSTEQRVLSGLAVEHRRYTKTESEINELRKTADQNADNLSKVAVSLADIAGFIDQTEIEQGVPPEQGKESSKRVNTLRDSALGLWQSTYNKPE